MTRVVLISIAIAYKWAGWVDWLELEQLVVDGTSQASRDLRAGQEDESYPPRVAGMSVKLFPVDRSLLFLAALPDPQHERRWNRLLVEIVFASV